MNSMFSSLTLIFDHHLWGWFSTVFHPVKNVVPMKHLSFWKSLFPILSLLKISSSLMASVWEIWLWCIVRWTNILLVQSLCYWWDARLVQWANSRNPHQYPLLKAALCSVHLLSCWTRIPIRIWSSLIQWNKHLLQIKYVTFML